MHNPLLIIKIAMFSAIPFIVAMMYAVTEDIMVTVMVAITMVVGDVMALRFLEKNLKTGSVAVPEETEKKSQPPQTEQL